MLASAATVKRTIELASTALAASIALLAAPGAGAAGFAVDGQGAKAMGVANAFAAQADDPSAVVFNPAGLNRESITDEAVEREKAIIRDALSGKPEALREKIMAGKLEKFFAEQVITEQPWVKDDKTTVHKALTAALGDGTVLKAFTRFAVGA